MWVIPGDALDVLYIAIPLFFVALSSLAAALTKRWWSGIVLTPLPILLVLGGDFSLEVFTDSLLLGLPANTVTGLILRNFAEPPRRLIDGDARVGALATCGLLESLPG